jgi:hypothetical protein
MVTIGAMARAAGVIIIGTAMAIGAMITPMGPACDTEIAITMLCTASICGWTDCICDGTIMTVGTDIIEVSTIRATKSCALEANMGTGLTIGDSVDEHVTAAIEAVFDSYARAWRANDAGRIESHWDTSDPTPFYVAEEIEEVHDTWPKLRAYWKHNETFHEAVELAFDKFQYKPVAADVMMVAFHMRWDIRFAAAGNAMGGDNRVLTLLRDIDGAWKLTAWIEAPIAPINYMRHLYERNVRPDFGG